MFNDFETRGLIQSIAQDRCSMPVCSGVVIHDILAKTEFGADFFHKILGKSILKPGSIQGR